MGPCPVPPTDAGSSTINRNPPACTEQSQPPSQVATAVLVPSRSPDAASVVVVVPVVVPVVVTRRRGRVAPRGGRDRVQPRADPAQRRRARKLGVGSRRGSTTSRSAPAPPRRGT